MKTNFAFGAGGGGGFSPGKGAAGVAKGTGKGKGRGKGKRGRKKGKKDESFRNPLGKLGLEIINEVLTSKDLLRLQKKITKK